MISVFLIAAAAVFSRSDSCRAATATDAAALLRGAAERTGLSHDRGAVLELSMFDVTQHVFESDRMYPPALVEVASMDEWFDPATGVQRFTSHSTIGGYEFGGSTLGDARASYAIRDTTLVPSEALHGSLYETRPLSVWAMLHDWLAATDVHVEGSCSYRDYPRVVLSRRGLRGTERLFLDPKSGYPVKLDRVEPHYLWGQVHVEFVYSTWQRIGRAHLPGGTFRIEDGVTVIARTFGRRRFVARDSSPPLVIPHRDETMRMDVPTFLAPTKPDTVRVSPTVFLLRNRGFTETIALIRDTVFVFDATQGDERVRQDALWIETLFPGRHPIVVVVTDLAWPHVAGVRAWVARGATIVSHRAAREFLARVVNRRWTREPDLLERSRQHLVFRFRAVTDSLSLAGGDVLVFPIDGIASEVSLAAFVRSDRFLWGGDYIQDLSAPTQYVDEVLAAVERVGLSPLSAAAQHAPLTPWDRVAPLADLRQELAPPPSREQVSANGSRCSKCPARPRRPRSVHR